MHRSRIRTTMLGNNGAIPESTDLFRHTAVKMEQVDTAPEELDWKMADKYKAKMKRILPYLALNEVIMGFSLAKQINLANRLMLCRTGLHWRTTFGTRVAFAAGAQSPECG